MRDASESEHEEDFMPSTTSSKPKPRSTRPSKNEREETLRKMMEEDSDEEMSNAPSKEETPPPAPPAKEKTPTPEPAATVSGGRRRGRRKVMRRKTVKDEEGYLSMLHLHLYFLVLLSLLETVFHNCFDLRSLNPD